MLTLSDVASALGGQPIGPGPELQAVTQDSRSVVPGSLFVALRGERQDGHSFIADALKNGASAILAEKLPEDITGIAVCDLRPGAHACETELRPPVAFLVPNSLAALQQMAAAWRQSLPVEVIGITGSVGKTTTKEMVASVLSQRFQVLKSERNLNNEIGLPLTVLQLTSKHQRAVLEMGMYGLGEIRLLCQIAKPRIGVVTNVGPTHLERLGTIDRIAEAKAELVEALPGAGWAILNGDDPRVQAMASRTQARVFMYGQESHLDLWADDIESNGLEGIRLRLHHGSDAVYMRVPLLGEHSVHTVLAASAVGLVEGLTWDEIHAGLSIVPEQLRLVVIPGMNGATIIDDTYNSSPASALAALNLLNELEGRHVAVLGDMLELGPYEDEGHKLVGRRAAKVVAELVVVGPRGRLIGEEALAYGMPAAHVTCVADNAEAISVLREKLQSGDCVLVKGSRGMKMEEIVQGIRGHSGLT